MNLAVVLEMETILQRLVEQVPSTVAVIVTVIVFIRFLKDREDANQQFFKEVHRDNIEARTLTRLALEKNASTISENILATERNTMTLERLARAVEGDILKDKR